jgi:hypothetical protein
MNPPNLTTAVAGLTMQFVTVLVLFVSIGFYQPSSNPHSRLLNKERLVFRTLALTILTFGTLLMCDDVTTLSGRVFGAGSIRLFGIDTALSIVFILDIIFLYGLVANTSGVFSSPYTPALQAIPAFALFLNQPINNVIGYTASIGLLTWWSGKISQFNGGDHGYFARENTNACILVALCMLGLTAFLGLVSP